MKGAGWLYRVERCLLRPTTLLNFLFKSGSNLNLWPINLEMVCGSGCPDFGSLGLSINPLLLSCFKALTVVFQSVYQPGDFMLKIGPNIGKFKSRDSTSWCFDLSLIGEWILFEEISVVVRVKDNYY